MKHEKEMRIKKIKVYAVTSQRRSSNNVIIYTQDQLIRQLNKEVKLCNTDASEPSECIRKATRNNWKDILETFELEIVCERLLTIKI